MRNIGFEIECNNHIDFHNTDTLSIIFSPTNPDIEYNIPLNIRYIGGIHQFFIKGCGVYPMLKVLNIDGEELSNDIIDLGPIPMYNKYNILDIHHKI